ncbi:MAG: hypothetical protein V4504_02120 [Patescibacteria group bacterium]
MEQNFQTSFIPKAPVADTRTVKARPTSFLLVLSIFVFLSVGIAYGSLYLYQDVLQKKVDSMKNELNLASNRFEGKKIVELQELDKRLNASTQILSKHLAISPIFQALQNVTLKTIRYTKFSYVQNESGDAKIAIKMSGQAVNYRAVALQADLFNKDKNIIDPVFSNLSLDSKGNVIFDLDFSVNPDFVNYQQLIKTNTLN